jgi:hypothetical protein
MTGRPLRIFISSTASDLAEYRDAVTHGVRRMRNHVDDMIDWTADDRAAQNVSVERVVQSDIIILIVAHWYGGLPEGESRSFVEIEYEAAKSRDIPVLCFLVDPDHPWLPAFIERDSERRRKLEDFKRRLERERVRVLFTTADSLVTAVVQALASFDVRAGAGDIYPDEEVSGVAERSTLRSSPDAIVDLSTAEDGLPLVLQVGRRQSVDVSLRDLAAHIGETLDSTVIREVRSIVVERGARAWTAAGLHPIEVQRTESIYYVSYNNLTHFFAPSVMSRILAASRRITFGGYGAVSRRSQVTQATPMSGRRGGDARLQSKGGENRYLAAALDSSEVHVVGWRDPALHNQLSHWRPFVAESLAPFQVLAFDILRFADAGTKLLASVSADAYEPTLFHWVRHLRHQDSVRIFAKTQITRQSVVEILVDAATKLQVMHGADQIHGDLKPQNMLVHHGGAALIDGLGLQSGEIAPAVTPAWASPEQLLLKRLTPSTDIHALGMMLCAAVGGELVGEQANYLLPIDGSESLEVPFIKDPLVYVDPHSEVIPPLGRDMWLEFIEACVAFDQTVRPANAEEFGLRLRVLLDTHPLQGTVAFEIMPNARVQAVKDRDGYQRPAHVLPDPWRTLERPSSS